jgi:hypothetical protein
MQTFHHSVLWLVFVQALFLYSPKALLKGAGDMPAYHGDAARKNKNSPKFSKIDFNSVCSARLRWSTDNNC